MKKYVSLYLLLCLFLPSAILFAESNTGLSQPPQKVIENSDRVQQIEEARQKQRHSKSTYSRWKRSLSFWPRKLVMLFELMLFITCGVIIGQILEISGIIKVLSILTWPITRLGALPPAAGPPLIMAFQSGAIANSMLVSYRDQGAMNNRHLYTAVLIVSCLSLFAHLPTFVIPIGLAFGTEATCALFGVRFAAIVLEIIVVLLVSNCLFGWRKTGDQCQDQFILKENQIKHKKVGNFWPQVWRRSKKTLKRLLVYIAPTFLVMATLEHFHFFKWLAEQMPTLFSPTFLPAQAAVIIPAQALSLYNGAIAAAQFVDSGMISIRQAVMVILVGSLVTAPIRTLKHALPTYVAVLGARPGTILAISAQVLRIIFTSLCIVLMMMIWQ